MLALYLALDSQVSLRKEDVVLSPPCLLAGGYGRESELPMCNVPTLRRGGFLYQRDGGGVNGVGEIPRTQQEFSIASGRGSHIGETAFTETCWRGGHGLSARGRHAMGLGS